ncbi:hypothetical protein FRX31_002243 [Thalictrum thalictroides]|uniref:Uncharacterized protein n=1 Tax=Thalictrum thalictroides TaxID=46969 RepID=A0A7J6XHL3_THATH|nr:hypothetical protein FRX31_002243 [Thalictrum thalictroides]
MYLLLCPPLLLKYTPTGRSEINLDSILFSPSIKCHALIIASDSGHALIITANSFTFMTLLLNVEFNFMR